VWYHWNTKLDQITADLPYLPTLPICQPKICIAAPMTRSSLAAPQPMYQ
jgi:hypothetical protein